MSRSFPRAGAFAAAVTMISLVSGAGISGAIAQDRTITQHMVPAGELPIQTLSAATDPAHHPIRFVAEEVVQPVRVDNPDSTGASSLAALVEAHQDAGPLSRELECLAQAVYYEARGEPLHGQLAVAHVVINRTASPRFPNDYCAVVKQPGQFSFVRGGAIPAPNSASLAWSRARAIARIAHLGLWDSPAGEALFFHASHVRPQWAGRHASVARINRHIFYK